MSECRLDIGELAQLTGLAPSALRHYEREGLLEPAGRAGGRRYYDQRGLRQLAAIDYWQRAGLTLREMTRLLDAEGGSTEAMKRLATARIDDLERLIADAAQVRDFLAHTLVCRHDRMQDCPEYQRHLGEGVEQILSGARRAHPPPRAPLRRTRPERSPPRPASSRQ